MEIKVEYLRVKVELFVPIPLRCFNCNRFGQRRPGCKTTAKCFRCAKENHEGECDTHRNYSKCSGPHATSAKDRPVWQVEKENQCIYVEERISFTEARQLVEAKTRTICSPTSYSTVLNINI